MRKAFIVFSFVLLVIAVAVGSSFAEGWTEPIRGSWVVEPGEESAVLLVNGNRSCEIVVSTVEHSAVQQAVTFLVQDLTKITGVTPQIVETPSEEALARIHVITLGVGDVPEAVDEAFLAGKWEAFQIVTVDQDVYLVGSNFRGTAFAIYTLSERLGIDPLYHWTGYEPERHNPLRMKQVDYLYDSPTFRYRGLFHDDEDILPRPIDPSTGYPYIRGEVPIEWYERYFETALRLKMNMVVPFTRAYRNFAVQKMASDWGLYYSGQHYDILISNPYGFSKHGLAEQRGISGGYDWFSNREGIIEYWKAGVLENRELDCIWPIGMRATDDYPYSFPPGTTDEEKIEIYNEIFALQVEMVKELLPPDKEPIFHFTMYNEMLDLYQKGKFKLPEGVILVWDDDGDGVMRALPTEEDHRINDKHGVYYHLAFFGWSAKQTIHTVTPMRIEQQFRNIVDAGATEYLLVNVSELREHVMEVRMIADIAWDAESHLSGPNSAYRFVEWWCQEYFDTAYLPAFNSYFNYYRLMGSFDRVWYGSGHVYSMVQSLYKKFAGESYNQVGGGTIAALVEREKDFERALELARQASELMTPQQRQFFYEHVQFGMLIDYRPVQAALKLSEALREPNLDRAFAICLEAFEYLKQLEREILTAERPPFEEWYRSTWIRVSDYHHSWSSMNPHRAYFVLRDFLTETGGVQIRSPRPAETVSGEVPVVFNTSSPRLVPVTLVVELDDREIYRGSTVRQQLSFDSTLFADGPKTLKLTAVYDEEYLVWSQEVPIAIANRWTLFDPLRAPQATLFGVINHDKVSSKSEGWVYRQDSPQLFFRDENRLTREADTTEYLIWDTPKLQLIQATIYVQPAMADRVRDVVCFAVSKDGQSWEELPYSIVQQDANDSWIKLELSAAVDGKSGYERFRLTLVESGFAGDSLQIGELNFQGLN